MRVRELDTDRREDVHQFVMFPFELYRDSPQWVPPLISAAQRDLDRSTHPFYEHSTAAFFAAEEGGRTVGRIAVMENRNYNRHQKENVAFFGYFDVVEDARVARSLFAAAFEWAHARGLEGIRGPKGLLGMDAGGALVDGFEHRPAMGVNYNYPYYDALIQDSGLVKNYDHLSGMLQRGHQLAERFYKIGSWVKNRHGLWIKSFSSKTEMRQWVGHIGPLYRAAFSQGFGFYPPTDAEIDMVSARIISIAHPQMIKLVMKGNKVIGFLIAYHDFSAGLQKAQGHLWPFGWYHLLRERRRTKWANVNGVGVLPEYQGLGANALLYTEIAKTLVEFDFDYADIVQVAEENFKSRSDQEAIGVKWYKRHRNYSRPL
jgi:hypothetical protein